LIFGGPNFHCNGNHFLKKFFAWNLGHLHSGPPWTAHPAHPIVTPLLSTSADEAPVKLDPILASRGCSFSLSLSLFSAVLFDGQVMTSRIFNHTHTHTHIHTCASAAVRRSRDVLIWCYIKMSLAGLSELSAASLVTTQQVDATTLSQFSEEVECSLAH